MLFYNQDISVWMWPKPGKTFCLCASPGERGIAPDTTTASSHDNGPSVSLKKSSRAMTVKFAYSHI